MSKNYTKEGNIEMNTKENNVIKEKDYQRIKKLLNKKDDYFTKEEIYRNLQNFRRNPGEIFIK